MNLVQPGFFPIGEGRVELDIEPFGKLKTILITERGGVLSKKAYITLAQLPQHIGDREAKIIQQRLDWSSDCVSIKHIENEPSPGNAMKR